MMFHHHDQGAAWPFRLAAVAALFVASVAVADDRPAKPPAAPPGIDAPAQPAPILPFDQVRIGMKGYGMTVFHGATIEPFRVEVVSVQRDFNPGRGVVWVRCPDERMQKSGPVHGMSGSPIYLWADGEPQEPGRGGKLIGAFAFGFAATKDCFVGVQPIEFMREVAGRVGKADAGKPSASSGASVRAASSLDIALRIDKVRELSPAVTAQAVALRNALAPRRKPADDTATNGANDVLRLTDSVQGRAVPAMMTMAMGSAATAELMRPLFEPMGVMTMASPVGGGAGLPPHDVDAQAVKLAPGSVLSIPLGWGDMDLSAVGTVTDVLPDGRVLGFGHAMYGMGPSTFPLATGYVHMVMPGVISSFKLGGSAVIRGAVVRDENSAVVGIPEGRFTSAPAKIRVLMPDNPPRDYSYQLVHHKMLTPMLAASVAMESVGAVQNQPLESNMRLRGELKFAGGRVLPLNALVPDSNPAGILMQILPAIAAMAQNQHESVLLEAMNLTAEITPGIKLASLASARLERAEVAPGESVGVVVKVQPFARPAFEKRVAITLPESLPEGDYELHLCDAQTYLAAVFGSRPHLTMTTNADELFSLVRRVVTTPSDALFLVMASRQEGVALGRQELPRLPSSRKAMLTSPTSTLATPFAESIESVVPMDDVVEGDLALMVTVHKPNKPR